MQKIIKSIIKMNDSNILNEKEKVSANAQTEEQKDVINSTEVDKTKTENNNTDAKTTEKSAAIVDINSANKSTESKPSEEKPTNVEANSSKNPIDEIELFNMDKDFVLECMSIPSHSRLE